MICMRYHELYYLHIAGDTHIFVLGLSVSFLTKREVYLPKHYFVSYKIIQKNTKPEVRYINTQLHNFLTIT